MSFSLLVVRSLTADDFNLIMDYASRSLYIKNFGQRFDYTHIQHYYKPKVSVGIEGFFNCLTKPKYFFLFFLCDIITNKKL